MIATAKDMISQSDPIDGCADPTRVIQRKPARAANKPDSTFARTVMRSVRMPESRAASALPPVARIRRPVTENRKKYPPQKRELEGAEPVTEERWLAPRGYSDQDDHHANFAAAVRARKPVTEDAVFGLRAAGPALLSNLSYYSGKTIAWDPINMRVKA